MEATKKQNEGVERSAHAFKLLAERCADRVGDSVGVLVAIREAAEQLLGGPALCLRLLPQTRELVPVDTGAESELVADRRPLPVDAWPALAAALEERRVARTPDPPRTIRFRRPLAVPLLASEQCIGVVLVDAADGRRNEPDGRLLDAFCSVAGALLQSALEQERTRRLSHLKGQFIALASHELRAPFAVMHGIIKTLSAREDLPPDQTASLRAALVEQSDRTARLIDQLLDLSRLDASVIPIERARFPIRPRIENLVRMVAGDRAAEVTIQVGGDLEAVADPTAFDRIVSNLVLNALQHGRAPVTVTARQRDSHFRLTVEDRGRGVDSSFAPRLFDRFARGCGPDEAKGSGLGLSIAQSYAQAHGGELVYSHADPHGARFELVLPKPLHEAERSAAKTSVA